MDNILYVLILAGAVLVVAVVLTPDRSSRAPADADTGQGKGAVRQSKKSAGKHAGSHHADEADH